MLRIPHQIINLGPSSVASSYAILYRVSTPPFKLLALFGPFNSNTPRRWKKPVDSARTRLESRTIDHQFDKLMALQRKLKMVLKYHDLITNRRSHHVFVEMLARWRPVVGLRVRAGPFLHGLPHVFELYTHPMGRALCCRLTGKMRDLVDQEARAIREGESDVVRRLKKLLMMSEKGTIHVQALWLVRRELGLPEDFRESILPAHPGDFNLLDQYTLVLFSRDDTLSVPAVEAWREKEYTEKWLSKFETEHAFSLQFPTGFVFQKGFREKLKNWQRLPYLNPYHTAAAAAASDGSSKELRATTGGAMERREKRVVAAIHELLSLTVEKMLPLERLAHFRKDLRLEVNVRELVLKHPGIFYLSTRAGVLTVFLREAYCRGRLVEPHLHNPVYAVRREMMDLIALGTRCTRHVDSAATQGSDDDVSSGRESEGAGGDSPSGPDCDDSGDWVLPAGGRAGEEPSFSVSS